jgi:hypothetical protein
MATNNLTSIAAPAALTSFVLNSADAPAGQCWLLFDGVGGTYEVETFPTTLYLQVRFGATTGTATSNQLINIPASALVNTQGRSTLSGNWGYLLSESEADALAGTTTFGQYLAARVVQADTQSSSYVVSGALSWAVIVGPSAPNGLPVGGTTGQALVKSSSTSYDATWATISGGSGSPGGSDMAVQYNASGTFAGSSFLTYNSSYFTLSVNDVAMGRHGPSTNHNIFYGGIAFGSLSTGAWNTSFSDSDSFPNITTGVGNSAFGYGAGANSGDTNSYNTAVGYTALSTLVAGGDGNTAVGSAALSAVTSGVSNTGLGQGAGSAIMTGSNNVVIGGAAGTAAMDNTVILSDGAGTVFLQSTAGVVDFNAAQLNINSDPGTAGQVLMSNATSAPTWSNRPALTGTTENTFLFTDIVGGHWRDSNGFQDYSLSSPVLAGPGPGPRIGYDHTTHTFGIYSSAFQDSITEQDFYTAGPAVQLIGAESWSDNGDGTWSGGYGGYIRVNANGSGVIGAGDISIHGGDDRFGFNFGNVGISGGRATEGVGGQTVIQGGPGMYGGAAQLLGGDTTYGSTGGQGGNLTLRGGIGEWTTWTSDGEVSIGSGMRNFIHWANWQGSLDIGLQDNTDPLKLFGSSVKVVDTDLVLPKTAGKGIMVDTDAPTFPWVDLLCQIDVRGGATTDPTWAVFKGVMRAYQFTINDFVWTFLHLPHDWLPGGDLYFHVHWAHSDPSITTGSVTWEFISTSAKGHNQQAFGAEKTTTVTQTASHTRYQHMIAEAQLSTPGGSSTLLDSNDLEPDTLVLIRTRLTANTMNGGPEPYVFTADAHYQSVGYGTKSKEPPFWT